MAAAKKAGKKKPSFEEGLGRLEELVEALESGELGLEDGVDHYKEGVELLAVLQQQLAGAEARVEDLTSQLRETLAELEEDDDDGDED
ncbi:MAG: exodeoxyribonuclease VII small subunit [Planctomycetes bacterium]|nr:exodeoxyribonuclease VII small subunit [Planctomycetota bacterium]